MFLFSLSQLASEGIGCVTPEIPALKPAGLKTGYYITLRSFVADSSG
jgi:hypothetical protein